MSNSLIEQAEELHEAAHEYEHRGEWDRAISAMRKAILLAPDESRHYYCLATFHRQLKQWEQAKENLMRAIRLDPEEPEYYAELGYIWSQQEMWQEAASAWEKCLQMGATGEEAIEAATNLVRIYVELDRSDDAITLGRELVRALQEDPETQEWLAQASLWLGEAYLRQERFQEAVPLLQRCVELNPNLDYGWSSLGFALVKAGNYDAAIEACQRALAQNPEDAEVLFWLGNAYYHLGRMEESLEVMERYRERFPEDARGYVGLAYVYHALGRTREALHACRRALKLDPEDEDARVLLGQLEIAPNKPASHSKAERRG